MQKLVHLSSLYTKYNHSTNSLREAKAEILLSAVRSLLENYSSEYYKTREHQILIMDDSWQKQIDDGVAQILEYLKKSVISKEELENIFRQAFTSKQNIYLAKQYEPMGVYLEYLSKYFGNNIKKGEPFIPELLAFALIYFYKVEFEKSFIKHPFIQDYDLSVILDIYDKKNMQLKREQLKLTPHEKIWSVKTAIDNMYSLAENMVAEYIKFSYKVNITRKSKIRKK